MNEKYISGHKAASLLGVGHKTISKWFNEGRFPNAFCLEHENGQAIRIPEPEVQALKQQPFKKNA
jgi:predicted DNA-binding transcriptional regulator AlpA